MLYLLYQRSGFIKKFPLTKKTIHLGRSSGNDMNINESFISQKHAKIEVYKKHVVIEDLGSTNGIFIETKKIKKAKIEINQSFRIGHSVFFLKEGRSSEFDISSKVYTGFKDGININLPKGDKTLDSINLLYTEPFIEMLQIGYNLEELGDIFKPAKELLDNSLESGCLVLISNENENNAIDSKWNYNKNYYPNILEILQIAEIFDNPVINQKVRDKFYFCSFPFILSTKKMLLIYLIKSNEKISEKKVGFLTNLSVEISVIDSLVEQINVSPKEDGRDIPEIVTNNQIMLNLLSKSKKIAVTDLFVIIEGETGTGKEMIAGFIHSHSKRHKKQFVALNCAAIPENLMEDELFGHEKGAFTDAREQKKGKLEISSGGTLVLDEIGDMPLSLQKKLLRAIQEEQFYRIGGNTPIHVDLRIICLTHKNISDLVKEKIFREDLFYRLNHVSLNLIPLRGRKDDILPLINYFVKIFSEKNKIMIKGFTKDTIEAMERYDWPGNIRELKNEINKIISLSENDDLVDLSHLKDEIISRNKTTKMFRRSSDKTLEKEFIVGLLNKHKWNKTLVAAEMNISRTALYEKLKKLNIT
ncbi:MAG: sigma 54-interacting transcriptional regulator [Acidobacteriota bacterium]